MYDNLLKTEIYESSFISVLMNSYGQPNKCKRYCLNSKLRSKLKPIHIISDEAVNNGSDMLELFRQLSKQNKQIGDYTLDMVRTEMLNHDEKIKITLNEH